MNHNPDSTLLKWSLSLFWWRHRICKESILIHCVLFQLKNLLDRYNEDKGHCVCTFFQDLYRTYPVRYPMYILIHSFYSPFSFKIKSEIFRNSCIMATHRLNSAN